MKKSANWLAVVRQGLIALAMLAGVTVLMLWLSGTFSPKVADRTAQKPTPRPIPAGATVVQARVVSLPVTESAVGSIRAQHETTLSSRILARVIEINLKAGQPVKQGDVLLRLDDTDLKTRLAQAKSLVLSAAAARDQALTDERRLAPLVSIKAVAQAEYDRALTAVKTGEADVARANQAVAEAEAILTYATIRAPMTGIVVDKKVDTGDTVAPGQPLVTLYDPERMQLVASVRESLARRLLVGQDIGVRLDVMDKLCIGQVSEIVPDAQSASRTFQVKVIGPCPPGLYTGMFGRIFVPLEHRMALLIPIRAVRHVGQLEMVDVATGDTWTRRAIRTGAAIDENVEVLAGLEADEKVIVPAAPATGPAPELPTGENP